MSSKKMAGLFLIVMGLVQVFQAFSAHTPPGRAANPLFMFATALLFTLGIALFVWNDKWREANAPTRN